MSPNWTSSAKPVRSVRKAVSGSSPNAVKLPTQIRGVKIKNKPPKPADNTTVTATPNTNGQLIHRRCGSICTVLIGRLRRFHTMPCAVIARPTEALAAPDAVNVLSEYFCFARCSVNTVNVHTSATRKTARSAPNTPDDVNTAPTATCSNAKVHIVQYIRGDFSRNSTIHVRYTST